MAADLGGLERGSECSAKRQGLSEAVTIHLSLLGLNTSALLLSLVSVVAEERERSDETSDLSEGKPEARFEEGRWLTGVA